MNQPPKSQHPIPKTQNPPPNILILMSDEHRADVAGFAGDPVARTPVLDALAETGVVFTNAYTPSPICIPARQAMRRCRLFSSADKSADESPDLSADENKPPFPHPR